jgi:uncharacterized protein YaaR (DUF327 family)
MIVAVWIIAVVELIRAAQNAVQLIALRRNKDETSDYIRYMKAIDRELADLQEEIMKEKKDD